MTELFLLSHRDKGEFTRADALIVSQYTYLQISRLGRRACPLRTAANMDSNTPIYGRYSGNAILPFSPHQHKDCPAVLHATFCEPTTALIIPSVASVAEKAHFYTFHLPIEGGHSSQVSFIAISRIRAALFHSFNFVVQHLFERWVRSQISSCTVQRKLTFLWDRQL